MSNGWHADPTGRNDERYWDGTTWTDEVRSLGGVPRVDPVGDPNDTAAPATEGTGPGFAPAQPFTPATTAGGTRPRAGLPAALLTALLLCAVPVGAMLFFGTVILMAGNDISNASDDFYYDDSNDLSFDLDNFGEETQEVGMIVAGIAAVAAFCLIAAGTGQNYGRVVTVLWLTALLVYLLSQVESIDGGAKYFMVVAGPPALALVFLLVPSTNQFYKVTANR